MKKIKFLTSIVLFAALILGGSSCEKEKAGVEMNYQRIYEIPSGLSTIATHNVVFRDIIPDTSVFFDQVGITSNDILAIEPRSMRIQNLFAGGGNLSALRNVEVTISAPDAPSLGNQIIFFRDDVPVSTNSALALVANNVNIKPFLMRRNYTITIKFQVRETIQNSIEAQFNWAFYARTE